MESREQHLSSVEVYTAPGIFLCEKNNAVCLFRGILCVFVIFLGLVENSKFKIHSRRFLPKNPRRKPHAWKCWGPNWLAASDVFPTQVLQPSCKWAAPRVSSRRMVLAWTFLDIQKAYCITWCYPQKRKETWGFCATPAKKTASSQKLAEQLSGHGLDKDKVPGSINTFYWG